MKEALWQRGSAAEFWPLDKKRDQESVVGNVNISTFQSGCSLAFRALAHDMTRLLAFVADAILLTRAVTRKMADLPAVVAFLALGAVTRHVAETTARVACLAAATTAATISPSTAESAVLRWAAAGDVSDFAALVAFSA